MRGGKEAECLDFIIQSIFHNKKGEVRQDCDGRSYLDVDEETFRKWWLCYAEIPHNFKFGLTVDDEIEFLNAIRKANANNKSSEFPDYIFDNGFIEHFQITSSKVTRKGSGQIIKEKSFEREVKDKQDKFVEMCNETPSYDKVRSCVSEMKFPAHSYNYLVQSFKKNCEHHLESMQKYNGAKDIGIFLIENSDTALTMIEDIFVDWKNGMSHGDLREQQSFNCYRLSRDKNMLEYLYGLRNDLKYVIYVYTDVIHQNGGTGFAAFDCDEVKKFEIIKTENIPYLLKLLPWNFYIGSKQVTAISAMYNISVKGNQGTGSDEND